MDKLELYYLPTCPYSQKVLRFLTANDLELELKSTVDASNRETLITVGGSNQVPCLFVNGEPMYESDDIIAYLSEKYLL
jgi:glutaredoxin